MRAEKTPKKAPDTKPSRGKKLDAETQNPLRPKPKLYRGANVGQSTDESLGVKKVFHTQNDFIDDTDDEQEIDAELTEAGANEPQSEPDMSRDDAVSEDREFELSKIGTEEAQGGLSDEDNDLEKIPDRKGTKIQGVRVDDTAT